VKIRPASEEGRRVGQEVIFYQPMVQGIRQERFWGGVGGCRKASQHAVRHDESLRRGKGRVNKE